MIQVTTASKMVEQLWEFHPDEPLFVILITGQDIKQHHTVVHPDAALDESDIVGESECKNAMQETARSLLQDNEDGRLEERIYSSIRP